MEKGLFEKASPFLSVKKIWQSYLADDPEGQREIEDALSLIHEKFHPDHYLSKHIVLVPPSRNQSFGDLLLGDIYYGENRFYPFGLRKPELTSHIGIFGRSGAGKTSFVTLLLKNFLYHRIPFLLFDWKQEYAPLCDIFPEIQLLHAGGETPTFSWNPFIPPYQYSEVEYQNYLKDIADLLVQSYYPEMSLLSLEGMKSIFLETAHSVWLKTKQYPNFAKVFGHLSPSKKQFAYAYSSLYSCLETLLFGSTKKIYHSGNTINLAEIFQSPTILELDCGSDADKRFLCNAIFYWMYQYRLRQTKTSQPKHALVMEEAHHHQGELLERIYRMIRVFGQSLVFIDQHPSLLSVPVFGNMYTTVCLNLKHENDITSINNTFSLHGKERNFIHQLEPGQALVKLQARYDRPFLIHFPFVSLKVPKNQPQKSTTRATSLEPLEIEFLRNILEHPQLTTVERYKSLHLNPRRGNQLQKQLQQKNLIEKHSHKNNTGRFTLFSLTATAKTALQQYNINTSQTKRHGGTLHLYWVDKIKQQLQSQGYQVQTEYPIGQGKTVDIMLFQEEQQIAIEIETGNSNIANNIEKCAKLGYPLIIIATSPELQKRLQQHSQKHQLHIFCVTDINSSTFKNSLHKKR